MGIRIAPRHRDYLRTTYVRQMVRAACDRDGPYAGGPTIETPLLAGLAVTPSALADTYAMLHPRGGTASLERSRSDATSKPVRSRHD